MKTTSLRAKTLLVALTAGTLSVGRTDAEVSSSSSADAMIDTRAWSRAEAVEDKALDTLSQTTDWSAAQKLNTATLTGTMLLVR
jgi:hypothetical protein